MNVNDQDSSPSDYTDTEDKFKGRLSRQLTSTWMCKGCKTPNNKMESGFKCKNCGQQRGDLSQPPKKDNRVSFDRFKAKPSVKVDKAGKK
jgi:hypothetical protein